MPSIKDKSTVDAIAQEFCSNGRNKEKTMRIIGYTEASCDSGTQVKAVFGNLRVMAAIAKIDDKAADKAGYSVKIAGENYNRIMRSAETDKQFSAAVAANTGHARLYGLDKDAATVDNPLEPLSTEDIEELRSMARQATMKRINTSQPAQDRLKNKLGS